MQHENSLLRGLRPVDLALVLLILLLPVLALVVVRTTGGSAAWAVAAASLAQAVTSAVVMSATIVIARLNTRLADATEKYATLTGEALEQSRAAATQAAQAVHEERRLKALDTIASSSLDMRWLLEEDFEFQQLGVGPMSFKVRGQCREWQRTWLLNRTFVDAQSMEHVVCAQFYDLTREVRATLTTSGHSPAGDSRTDAGRLVRLLNESVLPVLNPARAGTPTG